MSIDGGRPHEGINEKDGRWVYVYVMNEDPGDCFLGFCTYHGEWQWRDY